MRKQQLSNRCVGCSLQSGGPPVPGEGEGKEVIIIGEAPGRDERRTGRPFVGRSGRVLRGVLNGLDVDPSRVRITNLVKCRPPNNRTPTKSEIERCLPHLLEELKACPQANLLLLGATALYNLVGTKGGGITKRRGTWVKSVQIGNIQPRETLPTYHPAFIARPTGDQHFATFALDVQRALEGPIPFDETELVLLDTVAKVDAYFNELPDEPVVLAWDLETSGYRFYQDYILAMSLSHEVGRGWVVTEEMMHNDEVHVILRDAFTRPNLLWIGHSAKFDQIFTLEHVGAYPKLHADTMMMHLALDERKGTHDLKTLSRDLCGAIDWEGILWQYLENREDTYAKVPRDVLYKYAACDADYTLRMYHIFNPQLDEDDVRAVHDDLLMPASEAMMLAEYGGVTIDADDVDHWQVRLESELETDAEGLATQVMETVRGAIDGRLKVLGIVPAAFWGKPAPKLRVGWDKKANRYVVHENSTQALEQHARSWSVRAADLEPVACWRAKLVDQPFSAGSWQKVGALVYNVLGLEYLGGRDVRTRGQTFSTSYASLEPYVQAHQAVKMILALRTKKKLLSTYVNGLAPDLQWKVHPRWKMHATVTGRIGCTDPNVMNLPHEAGTRDFFIASPGHVLILADYSQAELRILATYSTQFLIDELLAEGASPEEAREAAMKCFLVECYRGGRDLHTEVTIALFGDKWGYDERMIAKAYNFGLVYGRTAKSIAQAFDMPLEEAQGHIKAFFERMPEVEKFLLSLELAVEDPGEVVNAFGRKRRFPYVDDFNVRDLQRQARNFKMQSTASDCTLLATARLSEWFGEVGFGNTLIFLHDSNTVEVPECAMQLTAMKMQQLMLDVPREYLGDIVPFKVDVQVGYGWGSMRGYDPVKGELL